MEALGETVGMVNACLALAISRASLYRDRRAAEPEAVQPFAEPTPSPRGLSLVEKVQVRQVLNSERFQDYAPR